MEYPVVLAINKQHRMQARVVMESIMMNTGSDETVRFIVLCDREVMLSDTSVMADIQKSYSNCRVDFMDLGDEFDGAAFQIGRISVPATYYRIGLPNYLPEYDKCLYLDTDVIVKTDIRELFAVDLEGYYMAGVPAVAGVIGDEKSQRYNALRLGIPSMKSYVNAGVLLFHLQKMRADHIQEKLYALIGTPFDLQDQDILNKVCFGHIKLLGYRYNVSPKYFNWNENEFGEFHSADEVREGREKPAIIHYIGDDKPWEDVGMKYADEWWKAFLHMSDVSKVISGFIEPMLQPIVKTAGEKTEKLQGMRERYRRRLFDELRQAKAIYIYGAGGWGRSIKEQMEKEGIRINGFLVSQETECGEDSDIRLFQKVYGKLVKEEALVVVAVSKKYRDEIVKTLNKVKLAGTVILDETDKSILLNEVYG